MIILIVFLPLFGFLSGILFGSVLGVGVLYITLLFIFISFLISCYVFLNVLAYGLTFKITLTPWIWVDSLKIDWSFCFDTLTAVMLIVVTFISLLVHVYSTEYMHEDPHKIRFMSYLSLFTFFMLILITANNFLQMFVGWEGVGLSSYLLINFWFTRIQANKAAIKAMLVNRVGDFFILISLFLIHLIFNSLDYDIVFNLSKTFEILKINFFYFNFKFLDLICLFLFFGAMGKSAQIGLHVWLPDAMEGPTPVSALIHAATMVTAGVFLIARCSFLFELSPFVLNFIVFIGSITAFIASTVGLFQNDIKKVIAYSTCSQLGYMIFACGLSNYEVGVFHLFNHAFFKALLFLSAGSLIHALSNEQDMRKMGGLLKVLPFSYAMTFIGSLALTGFPFLAGFYSKDIILETAFAKYTILGHFSFILGILAAFCTAFYSMRLIYLVFLSKTNGNKYTVLNAHEGSMNMTVPLFLLSILSIFVGFLFKDLFIGFGTDFWNGSIYVLPKNYLLTDIEFISLKYKLLPLFVTLFGILLAFFIYTVKLQEYIELKKLLNFRIFYTFFNRKWFFDKFYNKIISSNFLFYSYFFSYDNVDRGLLEAAGPHGLTQAINVFTFDFKYIQSGNLFHYLFLFFISIIFFFILLLM